MPAPRENKPPATHEQAQATEHIVKAHQLLAELRQRLGQHPELDEAILKLEMALDTLALKTGGML